MKFLLPIIIPLIIIFSCNDEFYEANHTPAYAVIGLFEPESNIQFHIEISKNITNPSELDFPKTLVEIYKDDLLIIVDTILENHFNSNEVLELNHTYRIELNDLSGSLPSFISREIKMLDFPLLESFESNDSLILVTSSQTLQRFTVFLDKNSYEKPYFMTAVYGDSTRESHSNPRNLTGGWWFQEGQICPELEMNPFSGERMRMRNMSCLEETNILSYESTNHRPGEFDSLTLKVCSMDQATLDYARWLFQNSSYQNVKFGIEGIILTKDNFSSGKEGYDYLLNRTCNNLIVYF